MLCVLELVCWFRCRVPLQGAAVRVLFALWRLVAGGCRCKSTVCALELGCWCRWRACFCESAVLLVWTLGSGAVGGAAASAAVRVQSAVCALETVCWCRCWVPLQGTAAWRCCQSAGCRWCGTWVLPLQEVRCEMSMAVRLDTSHQKRRMFGCCPKISFAIAKTGLNP